MATFFSVKEDVVKLLKRHLKILLQFVLGSAIFIIDWLDYYQCNNFFYNKFENRPILIYLFWLYIKLSILIKKKLVKKMRLELIHNQIYQGSIAESLILFLCFRHL